MIPGRINCRLVLIWVIHVLFLSLRLLGLAEDIDRYGIKEIRDCFHRELIRAHVYVFKQLIQYQMLQLSQILIVHAHQFIALTQLRNKQNSFLVRWNIPEVRQLRVQ